MQPFPIAERLTYGYVGTYSHLDKWREHGTAKLLNVRHVADGDRYNWGPTLVYTLALPRSMDGLPKRRVECILASYFDRHGCAHEHDCCGCASYTVTRIRNAKRREWCVTVETRYNY